MTDMRSDGKFCGFCYDRDDTTELQMCSRCKSIHYCSIKCQKADWKGHKVLCKLFAETKNPEEVERGEPFPQDPMGHYRRVIFFHPEKDEPEVIWVDIRTPYEEELLEKGHNDPDAWNITARVLVDLPYAPQPRSDPYFSGVYIVHRDNALKDGSKLNTTLARAIVPKGPLTDYQWMGPVILRREHEPGKHDYNISMTDYLLTIRYLREYRKGF